ncbi:hypothetical protein HOA93_03195 [bacterium]|nr:hypothetical protein [bacterium]
MQTEGLLAFALIIISIAFMKFSSFILSSRYKCTTHAHVSITGISDFFLTLSINFLHHLGIITSTNHIAL